MIDRDFEARAELLESLEPPDAPPLSLEDIREACERLRSIGRRPRCPACEVDPRAPYFTRICFVCGRLVEGSVLVTHDAAREHGSAPLGQREAGEDAPALVLGSDDRVLGVVIPRSLSILGEADSGRGRGRRLAKSPGASGGGGERRDPERVPRDPPTLRKHRQ